MRRRTTARAVGVLFVIATAAGALSLAFRGEPEAQPTAESLLQGARTTTIGALLVLVMACAIAMIPPLLFPVLKEHSEPLALGYVVARTVEVVLVLPGAIGPLMVLAVAREAAASPSLGASGADTGLQAVRSWSGTYDAWGYPASSLFFCLSVLLLNWVLYRSQLVPRALSVWALAAVVPYLADGLLVMFDVLGLSSPLHAVLVVPLAVNEMALALWLLTKGFNSEPGGPPVRRPSSPGTCAVSSAATC